MRVCVCVCVGVQCFVAFKTNIRLSTVLNFQCARTCLGFMLNVQVHRGSEPFIFITTVRNHLFKQHIFSFVAGLPKRKGKLEFRTAGRAGRGSESRGAEGEGFRTTGEASVCVGVFRIEGLGSD